MTLGAITALLLMRWAQSPRSSSSFRLVSDDDTVIQIPPSFPCLYRVGQNM